MVTYSDLFAFMSMICSIVTLVVTLNERKKQRPCPGKIRRYFLQITLAGGWTSPSFRFSC